MKQRRRLGLRARRRIYPAALAVAWVVLAAAVGLWLTSGWRYYLVGTQIGSTSIELVLQRYELVATLVRGPGRVNGSFADVIDPVNRPYLNIPGIASYRPQELANRWWIVQWESRVSTASLFAAAYAQPTYTRSVRFPFWLAILPLMIWPLTALVRSTRRRRRVAAQKCAQCGYDMRATPDRCPECGAVPDTTDSHRLSGSASG